VKVVSLSFSQVLFFALILAVVYGSYSTYSLKKKVYCTLIRKDTSRVSLWAKVYEGGKVILDGGWYYINPERRILAWYDGGIHKIFPTKIDTYMFKWDSSQPLDPRTWDSDYEKPEDRKNLDKTEDLVALNKGTQAAMSKTKTGGILTQYMPIITLVGFLVLGYFIWKMQGKMDMLGQGQNYIEGVLGKIMENMP